MTAQVRELLLVRHAAATGQDPSAPLTAEGEHQAEMLADVLQKFQVERVISSPFVRATASVAPFCHRAGLPLATDDRLIERVLSTRNPPDWRDHLRRSFDDLDYRLDEGESSRTAQARGGAVVQAALASDRRCVVVTHGNLLSLILKSVDAAVGFDEWSRLTNPDVFVVRAAATQLTGFERVWT